MILAVRPIGIDGLLIGCLRCSATHGRSSSGGARGRSSSSVSSDSSSTRGAASRSCAGYVGAGLIAVLLYSVVLWRLLVRRGLIDHLRSSRDGRARPRGLRIRPAAAELGPGVRRAGGVRRHPAGVLPQHGRGGRLPRGSAARGTQPDRLHKLRAPLHPTRIQVFRRGDRDENPALLAHRRRRWQSSPSRSSPYVLAAPTAHCGSVRGAVSRLGDLSGASGSGTTSTWRSGSMD